MKQLTTTNDQVKNLVQIKKSLGRSAAGKLAANSALPDFLYIEKAILSEFKAINAIIRSQMEEYDLNCVEGPWGALGFTTPIDLFKADGEIGNKFTKRVLDTDKVKAYMQLNNKLPRNVINLPYRKLYKRLNTTGA